MAGEVTRARESTANPVNAEGKAARTVSVESFLSSYSPKSRSFTSNDEIKKITKALGLDNMSAYELTEARNNVVRHYSKLMTDSDSSWKYMPALQSVTAVIDDVKWKKYRFV